MRNKLFIIPFLTLGFFFCQSKPSNPTLKSNFLKRNYRPDLEKIEVLKSNYESWLKNNYAKKIFPTIVTGIVRGNELIYSYTLGATDKTNYSTGSITKTFTATMTMRSIEKGLLSLNDPITKFFPKLQLEDSRLQSKNILIKNLLSHTSGLPDLRYYKDGKTHSKSETDLSFNISEQIYPTGYHYRYSNHGFQLLGEILQQVHGKPLKQIIQDEIFTPIGMDYSIAANTVSGAGGIQTNLHDLSRYASMWLNEGKSLSATQFLSGESVNLMLEPVTNIPDSLTKKYCGLTWRVERDKEGVNTFFHIGGANYTAAWVQMFPKYDIAVFYLSNPAEYDDNLMSQLITMQHKLGELATAYVGEYFPIHRTKDSAPSLELYQKYSGDYESPLSKEKAKVFYEKEKLYFQIENKNRFTIPFYTVNVTGGPGGPGAYEFAYDPVSKKVLGFSSYNAFYRKIE